MNHLGAMITAGFDVAKEPYLRGLLAAIRAHLLQVLVYTCCDILGAQSKYSLL